ncbi:MAG: sensor histidine kinase N-terminal domain-containing protein [Proteobacteria bacterium]|nr:sensor histidine kinase N-terminal domain-containing protein [Pseudomonadota bacterium]
MPEPRGWSLRTRLLVLLVCLAAALFGTSAVLNWRAHHEASDRLFDDSLRGSAHLLLQLAEHEMAEHGEVLGLALLQAETQPGPAGFHFQIWTPDMLAAAGAGAGSGSALQAPLLPFAAEVERFGWTTVNGASWRSYSTWNRPRTLHIQIAQEPTRHAALDRLALWRIAGGAAFLLAMAAVLMWVVVDATFRPLHRTAASVGERSEQDLREVDTAGVPREVRPLVDALNRLLLRIRSALQTERRFTADAAHELRTPLAAIRANAQVLVAARDQAEREATARDLLASVDRSTRLVEQLLALARADQPLHDDKLREVDLADVAREQLAVHRDRAEQCGVELRGTLQPGATRADPALLSVMVRNLLDNALRYTPPGGRITVATGAHEEGPVLTVEDDGPGIPEPERERVFERFHRLPGQKATGSGLGLSIVRRVADVHGARVAIAAGEGEKGTRVSVRFRQAA